MNDRAVSLTGRRDTEHRQLGKHRGLLDKWIGNYYKQRSLVQLYAPNRVNLKAT